MHKVHLMTLEFSLNQIIFQHVSVVATNIIREFALCARITLVLLRTQ